MRLLIARLTFQVSDGPGIIAGHSMGGHGAWMAATNAPDRSLCMAPAAGWIRKEEYAAGNAFFNLDIQNSFVDIGQSFEHHRVVVVAL